MSGEDLPGGRPREEEEEEEKDGLHDACVGAPG